MSNKSALGAFSPYNPDYGKNAALLAFGATMLQNAGRQPFGRGAPISTAQALGSAGLAGLGAYGQAEQQQYKRKQPIVINNRLVDPVTHETIKDFSDPKKRQVRNDWEGVARYVDTGERVFTGARGYKEKPKELPKTATRYRTDQFGQQTQYEIKIGDNGEEVEVPNSEKQLNVPQIVKENQALDAYLHQRDNATDPLKIATLNRNIHALQSKNNPTYSREEVKIQLGSEIGDSVMDKSPEAANDFFVVTYSPKDINGDVHIKNVKLLSATDDHPEAYLTDEGVSLAAEQYITDNKMVTMGRGQAAAVNRTKIVNKAAELLAERGIDQSEVPSLRIELEATKSSWKQLKKQYVSIAAFEKTAFLNADLAVKAGQVDFSTGVPILNAIANKGKQHVMGSAAYSVFNAANETFVTEYAKIMSGSMGNTPLSDQAVNHAHDMLNVAMAEGQYEAVVDILKRDMDNRMKGFDDQLESIRAESRLLSASKKDQRGGEYNPVRFSTFEDIHYNYKTLKDDQWYRYGGMDYQRKNSTTYYDPSQHDPSDPKSTGLLKW